MIGVLKVVIVEGGGEEEIQFRIKKCSRPNKLCTERQTYMFFFFPLHNLFLILKHDDIVHFNSVHSGKQWLANVFHTSDYNMQKL